MDTPVQAPLGQRCVLSREDLQKRQLLERVYQALKRMPVDQIESVLQSLGNASGNMVQSAPMQSESYLGPLGQMMTLLEDGFLGQHTIAMEEVPLNQDQSLFGSAMVGYDVQVDRGMGGDRITPDDDPGYEIVNPVVGEITASNLVGDMVEPSSVEELNSWKEFMLHAFYQRMQESDELSAMDSAGSFNQDPPDDRY